MKLLSQNYKLLKDSTATVYGLSLLPHKLSGVNFCPFAGNCSSICVTYYRGRYVTRPVRNAMMRRSQLFINSRSQFLDMLHHDLDKLSQLNNPHCRLNVASDLPWEKLDPSLFKYNIEYYDYTKIKSRMLNYLDGKLPPNYHLTFSHSERSPFDFSREIMKRGGNVAFVVNRGYKPPNIEAIPKRLFINKNWFKTVDGDLTDIRTPQYDNKGRAVLLRAKMKQSLVQQYIESGFILDV